MTMVSVTELAPRAERGATLLDSRVPRWIRLINLDTLDLVSMAGCVLGQCFGDYGEGLAELDLTMYNDDEIDEDDEHPLLVTDGIVRHGFDLAHAEACNENDERNDENYANLTEAWRQVIGKRLSVAAVAA